MAIQDDLIQTVLNLKWTVNKLTIKVLSILGISLTVMLMEACGNSVKKEKESSKNPETQLQMEKDKNMDLDQKGD